MSATEGASTVSWYLEIIGRTPLRTAQEEIDLSKRVRAGLSAAARLPEATTGPARDTLLRIVQEGRRATTVLTEANLRLVVSMARRYQGRGLDLPDLLQEGNLGLMTAVERFDPGRGFRFSTYASWWIRQGIVRGLATRGRAMRLPVHAYEVVGRIRQVELELWQLHGRDPTEDELAQAVGVTSARLHEIRRACRDLASLDRPLGEDSDMTLGALVADDLPGPEGLLVEAANLELIDAALGALQSRDRAILTMRFGLNGQPPQTLEQIGAHFGITRERIRQIELRALERLARNCPQGLADAVGA